MPYQTRRRRHRARSDQGPAVSACPDGESRLGHYTPGREPPASPREKRLAHILLSLDGRWLLDWTPRAASHGIVWTFLEANGLLEEAERQFPEGATRLHDYRFHRFYAEHGYCTEDDLLRSGRLRFKLVRNPYDRLVTAFLHLAENRADFEAHSGQRVEDVTFVGFLEWLDAGNLDRNVHWMPQRQPFEDDLSFWDHLIRAEDVPAGLRQINTRWGLNLKPAPARHRHASARSGTEPGPSGLARVPLMGLADWYPADYAAFFDEDTTPLAEALVGDDARFYGYRLDQSPDAEARRS